MSELPAELVALATVFNKEFALDDPALTEENLNTILGLAGTAAHEVVRPAAPVTTYVLGYLAGIAATQSAEAARDAAAQDEKTAANVAPVNLSELAAKLRALIADQT